MIQPTMKSIPKDDLLQAPGVPAPGNAALVITVGAVKGMCTLTLGYLDLWAALNKADKGAGIAAFRIATYDGKSGDVYAVIANTAPWGAHRALGQHRIVACHRALGQYRIVGRRRRRFFQHGRRFHHPVCSSTVDATERASIATGGEK